MITYLQIQTSRFLAAKLFYKVTILREKCTCNLIEFPEAPIYMVIMMYIIYITGWMKYIYIINFFFKF